MKTRIKKAIKILFMLLIFISIHGKNYAQSTSQVVLSSTSTSWTVPSQSKIASIKIQAWGGGGAGGGSDKDNERGGGGGGGGAFVEFTKTSGLSGTWFYVVGRGAVGVLGDAPSGTDTWINFSADAIPTNTVGLLARSGSGGKRPQNKEVNGGAGGSAANSFIPVSGGSGEILDGDGGEVGTTLAGGKGGDAPNGGLGGAELTTGGNGNAGSMPGGGGSGAFVNNATDRLGGNGGDGKIVLTITYIDAPTASNQTLCIGSKISDLVTSNTVPLSSVKWFTEATGGAELIATTTLTDNTTYYVSQTVDGVESDRTAVLVTLSPNSVAGSLSGGAIVCAGTNSTLLTLGGNVGTVQWQSSADGITYNNIASATGQTYTASNLTSSTYYRALVTSGACASLTTSAATVLVKQPGSWMGAVSTHWNSAGNWCGSIPDASTDVTISNDATNQPIVGLDNATVRSLTISTGSSLTITSNMTLNVFGDWINNGIFTATSGSVNFKKVGDQVIGGANVSTFNNISFEGGGSKVISKDVEINGAVAFTNGYITTANASKLIFKDGSSVVTGVANDASFAMVEVIKYGNVDFEFPIGGLINAVNKYRPIKISNLQNTSPTDYFKAQHIAENPLLTFNYLINGRTGSMEVFKNELAQTLSTVSNVEYWNLSRSNLTSVANVTMDFSQFPNTVANANFLRMAHYDVNAFSWENAPNASGTRSYDFATKKLTVTNVNSFSPFTIGSITAAALPVTLRLFTAKPTPDNKVSLGWVTSSEVSNKGFRIERQAGNENGKFEQIGFVASKAKNGNSQNTLAYNFIDAAPRVGSTSYYRLVQEDLDGKLNYTEVRMVKLNGQSVSMVFPNPSNGPVNISRTADGTKMNVQVIDQAGKIISQVYNIADANYRLNIPQSGVYTIKISYPETGEQSTQRIVVQK